MMYLSRIFVMALVASMVVPMNMGLVFAEPQFIPNLNEQQIIENFEKSLHQKKQNQEKSILKQFVTLLPTLVNDLAAKTGKVDVSNFDKIQFPKLDVKIIPNLFLSFFKNGKQSLGVFFADFLDKVATDQNNIFPNAYATDTAPPTVSIISPVNSSVITSSSITITGTASDNVAVSSVTVSIDGSAFASATNTGTGFSTWSYSATGLSNGIHTIQAKATDSSGNNGFSFGSNTVLGSTITVGNQPMRIAVNPIKNTIYIPNYNSNSTTVINGTTNAIIATITGLSHPWSVAINPTTNMIYVTNFASGKVSVINGANNTVTSLLSIGTHAEGIAYDSANGNLYVADGNASIFIINGTTNTVLGSHVTVGNGPSNIAYDSANGYLYVINYSDHSISVINGATNTVVGSAISLASLAPSDIAYDSANGNIYVASPFNTVTVINGTSNALATGFTNPIPVGNNPQGLAINPSNGYVYVTSVNDHAIYFINDTTNTALGSHISVGTYPDYVTFDPINGNIYVDDSATTDLSIISTPTFFTINLLSPSNSISFSDSLVTKKSSLVSLSDSASLSDSLTTSTNHKPVARNDRATTVQNTPVTIPVLANDTDTDGNQISILSFTNGTHGIVTDTTTYLSQFGTSGSGNGQFSTPEGMVIDSSGNSFVVDYGNNRIEKFDSTGGFLFKFGTFGSGNGQFSGPYRIASDSLGNLYVTDSGHNRVEKFNSTGAYQSQFGSSGSGNGQFSQPYGIAIDSANNIYVVDSGNNRIQKFNSAGAYQSQFGTTGNSDGKFQTPEGIAIDSSGNIYIADAGNDRIQKFDSTGGFLFKFGTFGSGNGQMSSPHDVTVDSSGNIYVLDSGNNRVQKFNSAQIFQSKFGTFGSGNGQFNSPHAYSVDSSGNLYVVDFGNNRIQKFRDDLVFTPTTSFVGLDNFNYTISDGHGGTATATVSVNVVDTTPPTVSITSPVNATTINTSSITITGTSSDNIGVASLSYQIDSGVITTVPPGYISMFGSSGSGNGLFNLPTGIALDSSGNIYVTDQNNHRVEKFNSAGVYQSQFGSFGTGDGHFVYPKAIALDSSGNIYVVDSSNNRVEKFNSAGVYQSQFGSGGTGNGEFNGPYGIALDSSDNVYVVDSSNERVEKFNSAGVYQSQFGSFGFGDGQFDLPTGITLDNSGNIYVLDYGSNKVQKFNSAGVYQSKFGSSGSGNGQFNNPYGIAVDSAGNVYVVDSSNNRTQKFNSAGVYQSQFGSLGSGNGQLNSPSDMALDKSGNIYVMDQGNNRVEKFGYSSWSFTKNNLASGSHTVLVKATDNAGNNGFSYGSNTVLGSTIPVDSGPVRITFDSANGNLYVANYGSNTVSVINGTTNSVIGSPIPVGVNPESIAFDSANGNLYVANYGSNTVSVINGATNSVIGSPISVGSHPSGIAFDSTNGNLYVTNFGSDTVTVINGTSNTILGSPISVGINPTGVTFDPMNGNLYVANNGANTVSVIKDTSNTILGSPITVGSSPSSIAFDSANGNLYVANDDGTVSVINGATNSVIGSPISVGNNPFGIALDSANGNLYVVNSNSNTASIINSTSNTIFSTISVGPYPTGIAYDSANGNLYVVTQNDNDISIISTPTFFSVDTTPPTISITSPVNATTIKTDAITISGTASDTGSGIANVKVSLDYGAYLPATGNASSYLLQFGTTGSGNGQFHNPYGIALDSSGNIYVVDSDNERVQKFNSAGVYQSQFGTFGSGNGQFHTPNGIALDSSDNIYVTDYGNNRVEKFNSAGVYQSQFGLGGSGDGQFNGPSGIALDSSGSIYVVDSGNERVQKFNSAGVYQSQFGTFGTGNGQFDYPFGIALDSSGNIYVVDVVNERVQKFNSAGVYQSQFGSPGTGNGQFDYPNGIALDSSDNIYVVDINTHRVEKFNSAGVFQSQFGTSGSGNGQFVAPYVIALDSSGIYVSDTNLNRVEKFGFTSWSFTKHGLTNGVHTISAKATDNVGNIGLSYGSSTVAGKYLPGISFEHTAYDSANGYLYIINAANNSVMAFNTVTNTIGPSIFVGSGYHNIAYDSANGYLYVSNTFANTVSVIDGATNTIIGSPIPVGANTGSINPGRIAYDSANGYIYVPNYSDNTVSVINGATNTVSSTISVGTHPAGIAYDSANGNLYVANEGGNTVTVINGTTNTVLGSPISVGSDPYVIAYDSANGYLYVVNYVDNTVSVINGATNTVLGSPIPVGAQSRGIAYATATGYLYVPSYNTDTVTVINGATNTIVSSFISGVTPGDVTYNPETGYIYVLNGGEQSVSVITTPTFFVVQITYVSSLSDSLLISDKLSIQKRSSNTPSDSISISDQVTVQKSSHQPQSSLSSSISFTDSVTTQKIQQLKQASLSDNIPMTDTVSTIKRVPGPAISSIIAFDNTGLNAAYGNGATITVYFAQGTNQPPVSTKSQLDSTFTFSQNLGANYTGTWSSPTTLVITISDSTGATPPAVGTFTLAVKSSANLLNIAGTSRPSVSQSPTLTGVFGSKAGPFITGLVINDPSGHNAVYANNNTITVTFSEPTNRAIGTSVLNKGSVDSLFTFSQNLGNNYNGQWINPSTFVITILDSTGSTPPVIGTMTATVKSGAGLKNSVGTSLTSTSTSPVMSGHFGNRPGPSIIELSASVGTGTPGSYSNGTTLTIRFAEPTNSFDPTLGVPGLSKSDIDTLFSHTQILGTEYTGLWITPSTLVITIQDSRLATVTLGGLQVTVQGNIRDSSGTSAPSTSTSPVLSGDFGHVQGPAITSLVASDPDGHGAVYSNGDTITVTFNQATNRTGGTAIQAEATVNNMFLFSQSLGTNPNAYSGQWINPSTFVITILDSTGGTPTIGTETVTVRSTIVHLGNAAGTSSPSTSVSPFLSGSFGNRPGPFIIELTASDPTGSHGVYSNGITITAKFSENTNQPGGSSVQNKAAVDNMFDFSQNLGNNYNGQWTNPSTFVITILDSTGAQPPTIGGLSVTIKSSANIKNAPGISLASTSTSPSLSGSFGSRQGPTITNLIADDPTGTHNSYSNGITISVIFSESTNRPGGTLVQSKTYVDDIFTFSQNLGANYTGQWTSPSVFVITIQDTSGAAPLPSIGVLTATVNQAANLQNAAGTSLASTSLSPLLSGTFGTFTVSIPVTDGGSAVTTLPSGMTTSLTLPSGSEGTIQITKSSLDANQSSSGASINFLGTVANITPQSGASCSAGCGISFTFTQADADSYGIPPYDVKVYHDANENGIFESNEALSTTVTQTSASTFIAASNVPFNSKFAIGGVVTALAVLGAHGGGSDSSQAFSAQGFLSLKSLSSSAQDSIRNEDPYVPLKPSNDPTVPYYPFSLDGNNYLIARYANTIQTVTEKVGIPINLQLASSDTSISHVALYTNMEGLNKEIGDSDTYVIYEKNSPLQIVDPHGFFSDVKIKTTTDNGIEKIGFSITFAKPMPKSNIFVREWDEAKYSSDTKIKDAIQIIESPQNTQTSKDVIPDKTTSQSVSAIPPVTDDLTNYIKQWAGYSSTSISDSDLLGHLGITGEHIPSWFMKTTKWLVDGDTSQQEFKEAITYMSEKGVIK